MGNVKQIKIKNRTCCFCKDIIDIEEFDSSLLKIDKKLYKDIDVYYMDTLQLKRLMIVKIFTV